VEELAKQKAQIVLLVRDHIDTWTIEYIEDLRRRTENSLIYAETCDLNSLHSVREFATKWIDSTSPRRLDMIICNAGVLDPPFTAPRTTIDGIERHWGVNFIAHYHLLNLLSPAIRAQPPDRDVRVIFSTCALYAVGTPSLTGIQSPWKALGSAKLALMMTAQDLQRQFDKYQRSDKSITNIRCYCVDPGLVRTNMLRSFLSLGSIWGLLLYLVMWPIWFIVLKSAWEGAQTILHCAMSPIDYSQRGELGWTAAGYYRDCREAKYFQSSEGSDCRYQRDELFSVEACEELKKRTDKEISDAEKKSAIRRNVEQAKAKSETK
jgi:NAD(P)-dependent dehydrogenase (short-subunit alcohol dehydrogenase family)